MKTTGNSMKRSKLIVTSSLLLILLFSITFGTAVFGGQEGSKREISIGINKIWEGVEEGSKPKAIIELFDADKPNIVIRREELTPENSSITWYGLPYEKGKPATSINYQVRELEVPGYESSDPVKMKYEITEMERTTRNNYLEWEVENPTFLIIKPTGNQPIIIWTSDHMPQADRAAFITKVKSFAAANDVVINPFDLDGEIMWIEGAKVSVDIFPEDDKRGQIDIEVEIKEDEIIKAKFHFQKESTWSQFIVGRDLGVRFEIVNSFIEVPPTTTEPTTTTTTTTTEPTTTTTTMEPTTTTTKETPTTETSTTTTETPTTETTTTTTATETPTTTTTTEPTTTTTTTEPTTTTTTETPTITMETSTTTTETPTTTATPVETTTETTTMETTTSVETTATMPTETLTTSETTTTLETTIPETTEFVTTETEETAVVPISTVTTTPTQQVETSPLPATGESNKGWQMAMAFLLSIIGILILRKSVLRSIKR